jgi:hypothetical protein
MYGNVPLISQITGLVSAVAFFTIVILLILWGMRRSNQRALPPGDTMTLEIERRRAEMAEAEMRALRQANLALHEEVDRLRSQPQQGQLNQK